MVIVHMPKSTSVTRFIAIFSIVVLTQLYVASSDPQPPPVPPETYVGTGTGTSASSASALANTSGMSGAVGAATGGINSSAVLNINVGEILDDVAVGDKTDLGEKVLLNGSVTTTKITNPDEDKIYDAVKYADAATLSADGYFYNQTAGVFILDWGQCLNGCPNVESIVLLEHEV